MKNKTYGVPYINVNNIDFNKEVKKANKLIKNGNILKTEYLFNTYFGIKTESFMHKMRDFISLHDLPLDHDETPFFNIQISKDKKKIAIETQDKCFKRSCFYTFWLE